MSRLRGLADRAGRVRFRTIDPPRGASSSSRVRRSLWRRARAHVSPAQILVLSFLGLVLAGTLGFKVLPGLYADPLHGELTWTDALFTATSAVCVTGLIVVDTATHFTVLGQLYILGLIQLGGLGMIGLASVVIVAFKARLSLTQDAIVSGDGSAMRAAGNVPTRTLVRDVILFTAGAELLVFLALFALWWPRFGAASAAWHALFHSVSAFCNAGFSTFSDSLVGFQHDPLTLGVIMGGVVVGGIGFLTLEELRLYVRGLRKRRQFRLSLHTRLVLSATLVAIVAGVALLGPLEWGNPRTLGPMAFQDKLVNALFLSITPRTAGFNTVAYDDVQQATAFGTILLMSVGGAPGGTAGGIKVTTVAVLVAMAVSRSRGRRTTDVRDRTIPTPTTQRAVGLFAFAFGFVTLGILVLTVSELDTSFVGLAPDGRRVGDPADFLDVMFEAVSAFNTVGLSRETTGQLTGGGRLLVVVLMFVGRVGPLTFAAALSRDAPGERLVRRYAHEDVVVG